MIVKNLVILILLIILSNILFKENEVIKISTKNNKLIDHKVYWINLDSDINRRLFMEKQFIKYNINNTRIPGVVGENLDDSYIEYICNGLEKRSKGSIGCLLSHLNAIKKAYEDGSEYAIIMEDDICISLLDIKNINLNDIINNAPKKWEILQLHYSNPKVLKMLLNQKIVSYLRWNSHNYSTGFYLINRKGMIKIINNSEDENGYILDNKKSKYALSDHYIYSQCITFTYTKPVVIHTASSSNVQTQGHVNKLHKLSKKMILDYYNISENYCML